MIEVLRPGMMLTVQDAGRFGFRHAGVSQAGPMDQGAHALANALVGNGPQAAALEFATTGGTFRAHSACRIAVTGGTPEVRIDTDVVAAGESHRMEKGQTLSIGTMPDSTWGYLAVSGGFEVPLVMGSRATHLRSGIGALVQAGAHLPLGSHDPRAPCYTTYRQPAPLPATTIIRAVAGPQDDAFAPEVLEQFFGDVFTVSPKRDRMAMVLDGPALPARHGHDIVSDGTVMGSVQVPGSGHPLVLMAESQTTGGYPKIATVIGADLARLAQLPTGRKFRFEKVTQEKAEDLWVHHIRHQRALLHPLRVKIARRRP
ncbi:biotin-dependent carboxyltransferase family protein [Falsirhodobacter sp. alg1]|uniref:5-oxoprolinase subunit C family protein n=1 Tax=Falsirhodobacter sp. alg1 TaxID=1472418 RepID=UPI0005F01072|nr:biotin-dependent carboxyltransferase family protein [Falsirhodobacter sp. alg1]